MADEKPIIIIKKGHGHAGHHGGAWKVAYADFVTAMMAFFMVMWLVGTADSATRKKIAKYFQNPGIFERGSGSPMFDGQMGILEDGAVPKNRDQQESFMRGKSMEEKIGRPDGKGGSGKGEGKAGDSLFLGRTTIELEAKKGALLTGADSKKPAGGEAALLGSGPKDGGEKALQGEGGPEGALQKLDGKAPESLTQGLDAKGGPTDEKKIGERGVSDEGNLDQTGGGRADEKKNLEGIANEIKSLMASSKELQDMLGLVEVKVDADGLNIEIMDTDKSSMFDSGSARIRPETQDAFKKLAGIIKKMPNSIDLVGHTDSTPFGSRNGGYSNWELSADRANAARRLLEGEGLESARFTSVVGRADKELKYPGEPNNAGNRRITLKMRFTSKLPSAAALRGVDAAQQFTQREEKFQKELTLKERALQADRAIMGTPAVAPAARSTEPTHSLTAKEILEGAVKPGKVVLPEAAPTHDRPEFLPRDQIFADRPVIGPPDPLVTP